MTPLPCALRYLSALLLLPLPLLAVRLSKPTSAATAAPTSQLLNVSEDLQQPEFEPLVDNKWARNRKFLQQLREPLCRPRSMLVSVAPSNADVTGARFSPERVLVERCGGSCGSTQKACVATASDAVRVPVLLLAPGRNATAGHVRLTRHMACACECATRPSHCTDSQVYMAAECRCGCRPELSAEAKRCGARPNFAWDEQSCRCTCLLPAADCPPTHVWVPQLCQCRPFLPLDFEADKTEHDAKKVIH